MCTTPSTRNAIQAATDICRLRCSITGLDGFDNLKQTDAKGLAVVTPALIGSDFFKEVAAIVNAGGTPDIGQLKAVYAKHGLVPALPQM